MRSGVKDQSVLLRISEIRKHDLPYFMLSIWRMFFGFVIQSRMDRNRRSLSISMVTNVPAPKLSPTRGDAFRQHRRSVLPLACRSRIRWLFPDVSGSRYARCTTGICTIDDYTPIMELDCTNVRFFKWQTKLASRLSHRSIVSRDFLRMDDALIFYATVISGVDSVEAYIISRIG